MRNKAIPALLHHLQLLDPRVLRRAGPGLAVVTRIHKMVSKESWCYTSAGNQVLKIAVCDFLGFAHVLVEGDQIHESINIVGILDHDRD